MARFYGWTHDYMFSMANRDLERYYNAIECLEAQELMLRFKVSDYPHLKSADRTKIFNNIHKMAYPDDREKLLSPMEMVKRLGHGR